MIVLYLVIAIIGILICYLWVKIIFWIFSIPIQYLERRKIKEDNNPYIKAQKLIDDNNRKYEDYLKWMSEHSEGVPIQKIKSKEEFEAETRLKNILDKM